MSIDDDGVCCPEGVDTDRWAAGQARQACIYGAPGWFAVAAGGEIGAVNVGVCEALFSLQSPDDGLYRIVASGCGPGVEIGAGPYADEYEAAMVCRAVVVLTADAQRWPAAGERAG